MKVIGYIRVSTDEQHLGPEAQEEALRSWCTSNNAELVGIHTDRGMSGGAPLDKRLGLLSAVAALQEEGAQVLLIAKRDRLARDVMVAAMVERMVAKAGAKLIAASGEGNGDGPESLLMRRMVDAFAEYERALIRSRTKAALQVKKSRGQRTGQVPYGKQLSSDGVHLEDNEQEQAILRGILSLREEGLSIRAIAERLNLQATPARGKKWHPTTVARILKAA